MEPTIGLIPLQLVLTMAVVVAVAVAVAVATTIDVKTLEAPLYEVL